jgi:hypothetical protein
MPTAASNAYRAMPAILLLGISSRRELRSQG